MVNSCSAVNCKNVYNKKNGITMHKFPMKDPELLKRWVQAVQRDKWNPTKWSVLCSEHFRNEDFYPDQSVKLLRKDAVPTIFSHLLLVKKRPPPKKLQFLEVRPAICSSVVVHGDE